MPGPPQPTPADMQSLNTSASYYPSQTAGNYQGFGQTPGAVNSPSTQDSPTVGQGSYGNQQPNIMSSAFQPGAAQQMNGNQDTMTQLNPTSSPGNSKQTQPFGPPMFDPSDPSIFNFDISTFNFGNHYGAMEFGMLGHMSSGAVGTPEVDNNMMNTMNPSTVNFDDSYSASTTSFPYNHPFSSEWPNNAGAGSRQNSSTQLYPPQLPNADNGNGFDGTSAFPNAFAIADGSGGSISSASPNNHVDFGGGYASSPVNSYSNQTQGFTRPQNQPNRQSQNNLLQPSENPARKKRRDPSEVYYTVTAPYSYTTGFHCLVAFVSKRFNAQKTLRIAKALASIRPSFISCSNKLTNDDLIFMEKLFQRTLYEYEGYMQALGTPTVLFRRTGEVASASKEFSLLSGWRKDVLLGAEPNLNVNTGGTSGVTTGASTRGAATPRVAEASLSRTADRPQSVFLAELIDEDSVIGFYEDFAKHAFGDARGTVSRRCKLLKYRTKEDPGWGNGKTYNASENPAFGESDNVKNSSATGNPLIMGEDGINALGVRDGKVDCMLSWTIKRDPFDVPMLIIVNVSHDDDSE